MPKGFQIALCIVAILVGLTVIAWTAAYPDGDPKSMNYVLWKHGLHKLNLDTATGTMIGDSHRDELVVGKARKEIERRFGPCSRWLKPHPITGPAMNPPAENPAAKSNSFAIARG